MNSHITKFFIAILCLAQMPLSNAVFAEGDNTKYTGEEQLDFSKIDFDGDDDNLALSSRHLSRKRRYRKKKQQLPYETGNSAIVIKTGKIILDPQETLRQKKQGLEKIEKYESRNSKYSVRVISRILLTHPLPEIRAEAADALGRMKRGLYALHRAIRTDGYEVRYKAYHAIEKIGSRTSLRYFARGIHSSDIRIVLSSYRGLGKTRTRTARRLILKYGLRSSKPKVVAAALDSLGYYSYTSDLKRLARYLQSPVIEHRIGAIRGLGNHRSAVSLNMLTEIYDKEKQLEADIIFAVAKKQTLSATLVLLKIMNLTHNENYKAVIERELMYRKAFGRYAIIHFQVATIRKYPRPRSSRITRLRENDVARIKKTTYKRYKARLNGRVVEDRYYLLQAVRREGKYRGKIVNGWVFGPKIKVITIRNPESIYGYKRKKTTDNPFRNLKETNSEDEIETISTPSPINNSYIEANIQGEGSIPKFTNEKIENDQDEDTLDE